MTAFDYDLVVLGAGSGGVRASRLAAKAGARVAVVESSRVGGTCVMRGCVPKKLLVMGSRFAEDIADAAGFGWDIGAVSFDWARLVAAKNAELNRLESVYLRMLRDSGVDLVEGRGGLAGPHAVAVAGRTLSAERVLIATGGRPWLPQVPGIEHAITSNEALDLMQLPARMVIVGGGYIAVEFAGIFAALGVKVTQILRGDTLLRGFDQDVRAALTTEMAGKGVEVRCETVVRSIERAGKAYSLRLSGDETIETDLVLYATGRRPNTEGLGLEEAGIGLDDHGAVKVDQWSRTALDSVYAIGDVTDRLNLTPVALAEANALVATLFEDRPTSVDYDNIPTAVFSNPPVGTVGLSEAAARRRCGDIHVYLSRFKPMRNTLAGRDERTLMKLVVDAASDRVVGLHVVGPDAPEMVQGFAVAMKCGATKAQFDATIGIHPTAAEELVTLRDRRPDPCPEDEQ
ncbi:glutathione-disulfide reductase [Magnetospirillum sp. UT-4]|uniref:glutathione-disulfide reductase n=1 Tax=Magnetospirillum sp. UT-4 TaxID=2681467 RepID=UPI001381B439|nr:glutathione-disulfide reductase [Magnetospirillum sp. UT-4]CAA7627166.1 Glutathione reductase [Magnetospirillum sp. UT-4]